MSLPRFSADLGLLFGEWPMLDRFAAAADAGFSAVEIPDPYAEDPEALARAAERAGLAIAAIDAPHGNTAAGERGLASIPGRGAAFESSVRKALRVAEVLDAQTIHVPAGVSRGPWARLIFIANLKRACEMAPHRTVTISPGNRRDLPGYHLVETADAQTVLSAVGAKNLAMTLDIYHTQVAEGDVTRRIEAMAGRLAHVRIAGVPDRCEPDRGELSLAHVLSVLERVGYSGWIGCAYRPAGRTVDGLGWMAPYRPAEPVTLVRRVR